MTDEPEDWSMFTYDECTCSHDPEDHGWGECGQPGCRCEAGWEE